MSVDKATLLNPLVRTQNTSVCLWWHRIKQQHSHCAVIILLQEANFLNQSRCWEQNCCLRLSHDLFWMKASFNTFIPIWNPCDSFFLPGVFYVSERRRQASLSKAFPVIFLCSAYHYCNDKVRLYTLALFVYSVRVRTSVCACVFFITCDNFYLLKEKDLWRPHACARTQRHTDIIMTAIC